MVGIYLALKGRNLPFVNDIKYLGATFERKLKWRYQTDSTATKALGKFIRICSVLKSERLSAKSKLTLYKALIRSQPGCLRRTAICGNCSACKIRVLRTTGNLLRRTPTGALHLAFQIPYVYVYITKV
jgi:hypothetical protein